MNTKRLIYVLVLLTTSIVAGQNAEQLSETIERRFKALPECPEYLHGTSSGIQGTISDATIQLTSGKRLEEYDKWHTIAIDYRSLAEIQLIRTRRAVKAGDVDTAKRCIDESDRDVRIFNSAYLAAISTYQANIEQAAYYTKAVYETSRVAFVFTSSFAGLGPVATVASDYLYTATDFTVNTSEEGLSYATKQAVIDILTQQVGKQIFSSGDEAFTVNYKTDLAKIIRKLSKDPRFRQSIQETVVTSTQQNLTETFIAETLSNIADEMENKSVTAPQKTNLSSISQNNKNEDLIEGLPIAKCLRFPLQGKWEPIFEFNQWRETRPGPGYHLGEDIGRDPEMPVFPIASGIVKFAQYLPDIIGYGVIIEHNLNGQPFCSIYYHMRQPKSEEVLKENQCIVNPNIPIGYISGKSADHLSSTPHLHFGIRMGPYKSGFDERTKVWYYPGYTTIYPSWEAKSRMEPENNSHNQTHLYIVNEWRKPSEFIAAHICSEEQHGDFSTVLVIDKSGSMTGDKINKAKKAAYGYVDASGDKDILSLVGFSTSAQSILEPSLMSQAKERLKQDIFAVSAGGSTNIGSGLTIAHKHLSSCDAKGKMALLMTDGQHNTGTYKPEVEEFIRSGWPIYTVAFGKDADQDTLRWIAERTNGCFFPADSFNLTSIYHRINVQTHNGSIFRGYSDFVKPGKKLAYSIPVEAGLRKIGFYTNWQGSYMETTITSPAGQVINKNNYSQLGKYNEEPTYTFYEIDNPQSGNWQVQIIGFDVPASGEQINFHSFSYSDISSNILAFQPDYSSNQQVQIAVKVAEVVGERQTPLKGIEVLAEVKKPPARLNNMIRNQTSGINRIQQLRAEDLMSIYNEVSSLKRQVRLYDDGLHGDVNPGDGIYANTYGDTPSNGPYVVTVVLQGNSSTGKHIDRTLQETFQVGPIENNTFTVSEFLELITNRPQIQEATKQVINVIDQLFKKGK